MKKEIEEKNVNDEDYLKLKRSNEKKKATIVVLVFALVIVVALLSVFLILGNKNKGEKPKETGKLSNEEAITIAKTKFEAANNLLGDQSVFDECDRRLNNSAVEKDDEEIENYEWTEYYLCYNDTLDNFKAKFYDIYASSVMINEVYAEYDINDKKIVNFDEEEHNDVDSEFTFGVTNYAIKDNNIYIDNGCRAEGREADSDNWEVVSIEDNKIIVKYDIYMSIFDDDDPQEERIVLIKEENEWKIEHATIFTNCGIGYRVGK